jgi:hypothetical protein
MPSNADGAGGTEPDRFSGSIASATDRTRAADSPQRINERRSGGPGPSCWRGRDLDFRDGSAGKFLPVEAHIED